MDQNKPFFSFLAVLVALCVAFGFYVASLKSCSATDNALPGLECHKLYLAFGVLFAVAIMLALGAAFYALIAPPTTGDHPGKQIFDTLSKSLVPVITLVLGYYFGSAQVSAKSASEKASPPETKASVPAPAASAGASAPARK